VARLAETLLPLLDPDPDAGVAQAQAAIEAFPLAFQSAYTAGLRRKLGLYEPRDGDLELAQGLLQVMADGEADFTLAFRGLCAAAADDQVLAALGDRFKEPAAFAAWAVTWRARLALEGGDPAVRATAMRAANPAFIPRNHQVEAVIQAAQQRADFAPFDRLLDVLAKPYDEQPDASAYALPPTPDEVVHQTFCGT
jgi:serine/tyrosine/threonine adenylyltransferase